MYGRFTFLNYYFKVTSQIIKLMKKNRNESDKNKRKKKKKVR